MSPQFFTLFFDMFFKTRVKYDWIFYLNFFQIRDGLDLDLNFKYTDKNLKSVPNPIRSRNSTKSNNIYIYIYIMAQVLSSTQKYLTCIHQITEYNDYNW